MTSENKLHHHIREGQLWTRHPHTVYSLTSSKKLLTT